MNILVGRFSHTVLFALLLLSTVSCEKRQDSKTSSLQDIRSSKTLRVGYLVWPPCVVKDAKTGDLSGIYPDMVNEIAKAMGVEVAWQETTLATFAAGLQTNQFHFSVGPTFITIPRSTSVAFTPPLLYVGNSGIVRGNGDFNPQSIGDLNQEGITIAVLQGQALEEYCRVNVPNAKVLVIAGADLTAPLAAVTAGKADIGMMNTVTVQNYALEHPEVSAVLTGKNQIEVLPLAWSVNLDDTELKNFLDSSIIYLKSTGKFDEITSKYKIKLLVGDNQLVPSE